jgi:hypothetical protein
MMKSNSLVFLLLFWAMATHAQLAVSVSPPKTTGSKTLVKVEMLNVFPEKVESARAACFLLDAQGKIVGQSTKWVIGGSKDRPPLEPDKKTSFHFVIETDKDVSKAEVVFNRLVLDGGKLADIPSGVKITPATE